MQRGVAREIISLSGCQEQRYHFLVRVPRSLITHDDDDTTIDGDVGRVEINLAAISTDSAAVARRPRFHVGDLIFANIRVCAGRQQQRRVESQLDVSHCATRSRAENVRRRENGSSVQLYSRTPESWRRA